MNLYEDWKGRIKVPVTTIDIGAKVVPGPDFVDLWKDQVDKAVYGIITRLHDRSNERMQWLNVTWYNQHDEITDDSHVYWIQPKDELYALAYYYDYNELRNWLKNNLVTLADGSTETFYNHYDPHIGLELYVAHLNSQRHGN